MNVRRGFTFVELLISIAIVGLIVAGSVSVFGRFNKTQALGAKYRGALSLLQKARAETLAAKEGASYGVHVETNQIVLFKGNTYSSADPANEILSLDPFVQAANGLTGGASEILFKRLSGETDQAGTITLSLISDPAQVKTLTIQKTGAVQ